MVNLLAAFRVAPDQYGNLPPPETVNLRIIVLAVFGAMAATLFGYDLGFIGGVVTLPAFLDDFDLSTKSAAAQTAFSSNVVSVFQAGAIFGALCSSFAADRIGRRACLMANLIVYLVGAAFMTGASGHAGTALVYLGRVFTGWAVGASTMLVPVYVAECSPPHIRGRLVGLYEVGVQFGTMIGFWIPYGVLKTQTGTLQWRIPFAIQLIPAGACVTGLVFLTETPRFMVRRHGEARALRTIAYLRSLPDDHPYVVHELAGIVAQNEHERDAERATGGTGALGIVRESFGRHNIRRLFTGCMISAHPLTHRRRRAHGSGLLPDGRHERRQLLQPQDLYHAGPLCQQCHGEPCWPMLAEAIATVLDIGPGPRLAASTSKRNRQRQLFATGVYGVVRFVATLIAMVLFADRFGRRSMIVVGGSLMAVCMWTVGALTKTSPPVAGHISPSQYAAIVLIFVWAVAFCFSYAGIPWIYCSEIFPLRIRTFCMALCTSTHWAFNLMLAKSTPYMIANLGGYGIYFVFAACTTVGAVWEYFYMIETRGRTLEEIDELFSGTKLGAAPVPSPSETRSEDIDKEQKQHVEYSA
ncbi:hypothetical protein Q5752_004905 [Cryptotrichosporon argae]